MSDRNNFRQREKHRSNSMSGITTLADFFLLLKDDSKRKKLEEFRIKYESEHGPTDFSKYYTCLWPNEQQDWLIEHDVTRYMDGLPPFLKAYLEACLKEYGRQGCLDDVPADFVKYHMEKSSGRSKS